MKPTTRAVALLIAAVVLPIAVGCSLTNSERRKAETATAADIAAMRQDIERLQDEVSALGNDVERSDRSLRADIADLKQTVGQLDTKSADRVDAAKQELAAKINDVERKRISDKNALNKKMDWIADQLAKVAGTSGGAAGGTRTEKGFEYVVKEGDTVWKIASTFREQYGTTVEAILKANGLDANSIIRPGDKLFIPVKE